VTLTRILSRILARSLSGVLVYLQRLGRPGISAALAAAVVMATVGGVV
jgi:hypothetical protein